MAKEIKFNIKLLIDGKEQLVSTTSTVENLRGEPHIWRSHERCKHDGRKGR